MLRVKPCIFLFCKIRLGVYEQKITTLFVNRGGKSMFGKIVKTVEKVEFKIKFLLSLRVSFNFEHAAFLSAPTPTTKLVTPRPIVDDIPPKRTSNCKSSFLLS